MTPESALGLNVARQTINNHFDKIARLYEQGAGMERIGRYVKGWWQWVNAGVDVIVQRAEELWKQKWDEQQGGIKRYMTGQMATFTLTRKPHGRLPWNTHQARKYSSGVCHDSQGCSHPMTSPTIFVLCS